MPWGWEQHIDKRGTPCAYCEAPSTRTLVLEEDQYSGGELKRRGKRIGLCATCQPSTDEDGDVARALSFRRRRAKDIEQLAMDVDAAKSKRDAIYGNESR